MTVKQVERPSRKTGKKNKKWVIDICRTDPFSGGGIRYRRDSLVQTKRAAEDQERQVLNSIADGTFWNTFGRREGAEESSKMLTVEEFFKEFMKNYCEVNNKYSEVLSKRGIYDRYLKDALGELKLDEVTVRTVDALKADLLRRKLHPKTINNALATVRRLLNYAVEAEVLEKTPRIKQLKVPEAQVDFLTFEELDTLIEAASFNPEWKAMIVVAAKTGVRWGELSELRWGDIDLEKATVCVERNFSRGKVTDRKNRTAYTVPLTPKTVKFLKRHQLLNVNKRVKTDLVFCKPDGGRHIHRRADVALKRCCRKAGIRKIGWHILRHTFASHLAMRGKSLLEIKNLLGHKDIKSTLRYAHLMPEHNHDAVAVLDEPPPVKRQHSGNREEDAV